MSLATLILWAILGLREDWQPTYCDRVFATEGAKAACEERRDEGRAWAEKIAGYLETEITRQGMEGVWDWVVGVMKKESDFSQGDICPIRLLAENIISREVMDADVGREKVCWSFFIHRDAPAIENCQPVLVLREEDGYVYMDRCAAGEAGLFQITPNEARSGQVVPATGEELPRAPGERRLRIHDPQVNISLGLVAMAKARDLCCCTTTVAEDGTETQTCDEECRADPHQFLGAYNTGHCSGTTSARYLGRVNRGREQALEYVCTQLPDWEGCVAADGEGTAEAAE
jgi:hypothetical protein